MMPNYDSMLTGKMNGNNFSVMDNSLSNSQATSEIYQALKRAGGSGNALEIALAIALPELCIPVRYATEFTSAKTATSHPFELITTGWSTAANPVNQSVIPANTAIAFLFRDPTCTLIHWDPNEALRQYEYQAYGVDVYNGDDSTGFEIPVVTTTFRTTSQTQGADAQVLPISYLRGTNTYLPHGPVLMAKTLPEGSGADVEGHFFWVDNFGQISGTVSLPSLTETIIIYAKRFSNNQGVETPERVVIVADGTPQPFVFNELPAGDYQLSYIVTGADANTDVLTWADIIVNNDVSVPTVESPGVWCHRALPQLFQNLPTIDAVREFGLGLKISNKAAALYRDGYVAGIQASGSDRWTDFVRPDVFSFVASKQGEKDIVFDKGFYGFIKPDSEKDFQMETYWKTNELGVAQTYGPCINKHSFLVVCAEVTTVNGRNSYWTVTNGSELATDDVWRQKEITKYTPDDFKMAMRILKDVPQFHQNELHIAGIFNAIRNAAKNVLGGIQKYGPGLLQGAAMASSFL